MRNLPDKLYSVDSVVQLERVAIDQYGIPAYELMKRAGEAVFKIVSSKYSQHKKILILCGAGNNAGDGYVVARLAKQSGFDVRVISMIDPASLKNEALLAYDDWSSVADTSDLNTSVDFSLLDDVDLIVDALLGTGLTREVTGKWAECINAVNDAALPVISVDIPSGLIADTGVISSVAIKAEITVSFIGLKQGMFTAQAKDVCGDIIFDDLALPDEVYSHVECDARLISSVNYDFLPERKASSHKGCFGHVLIAGGSTGMPGAVILAARAALRTGAGLVSIVTISQHLEAISSAVPEAMVKVCDVDTMDTLFDETFVNGLTHVAIGMGLGQDEWSLKLLKNCVRMNKPMLIDADALNLMARHGVKDLELSTTTPLVITPHPGEAARLLSTRKKFSTADVQADRFKAVKALYALFGMVESCVVILKGSGTIIFDGEIIKICQLGNSAMAAPGMGDVLSGVVIALMAQNSDIADVTISEIAELAVCIHASAADSVSKGKTRGLLASDVVEALPGVLR
ncbi:MAG: NAD(P)H-hydrate dehydratase [Gammaproteobacteria bacterium]|nr:NAD(P)H-hydrate dehydratase [Gammaproteobacteria bacterium]